MDSKCEYMQDHARELFASYQMNYLGCIYLISLSRASGNIYLPTLAQNNVAPQTPPLGAGVFTIGRPAMRRPDLNNLLYWSSLLFTR